MEIDETIASHLLRAAGVAFRAAFNLVFGSSVCPEKMGTLSRLGEIGDVGYSSGQAWTYTSKGS